MKAFIPDQILAEWFIKSLLPKITEDVAKAGVVTEKQFIAQAQYLDLIYTQSHILHEKIPNHPKTIAPLGSHATNGMIRSFSIKSKKKSSKNSSPTITLPNSPKGDSSVEVSADVHVVDSSTTKSNSKEKGKTKKIKIQKIKQIKMNLLTKNKNLAILVSFAMRIILPKNAHIE